MLNEEFLVKVVDHNWIDIIKYDTLHVLCRISDLFVKVIDVEKFNYIKDDNRLRGIILNDSLVFSISASGSVNVHFSNISGDHDRPTSKQELKLAFDVPSFTASASK